MQVGGQVIDSPEVVVGYEIGGLSGVTVVFESARGVMKQKLVTLSEASEANTTDRAVHGY